LKSRENCRRLSPINGSFRQGYHWLTQCPTFGVQSSLRPTDTDWLLLVISEHSTESSWVNFEVSQFIGLSNGNNIIPVVLAKGASFPRADRQPDPETALR